MENVLELQWLVDNLFDFVELLIFTNAPLP